MRGDSHNGWIASEETEYTGTIALIAAFRNKHSDARSVLAAFNVVARIFLRDEDGTEIGSGVSPAVWLDTFGDTIDIPLEDTKHVVLLENDRGKISVPYKRHSQYGTVSVEKDRLHHIEVKLVDQRRSSVLCTAKVRLDPNDKLKGSLIPP